jgi:hypothetical protein
MPSWMATGTLLLRRDQKAVEHYSSPDPFFKCFEIVEEELSDVQAIFGDNMLEASNRKLGRVERRTELETLYRPFVPGFTRNPKNPEMTDCFKRSLEAFLGLKLKRPKEAIQDWRRGRGGEAGVRCEFGEAGVVAESQSLQSW